MRYAGVVLFLLGASAWGQKGQPPFGVELVPYGTAFRSFSDYEQSVRVDDAGAKGKTVTTAEIEIRFPEKKLRVLRYPYPWDFPRGVKDKRLVHELNTSSNKLGESEIRRLGKVAPGEYQVALLLNGARASNVISIQIDPAFDPAKAPALEIGAVEPDVGNSRARLVIFARGPTPFDKSFFNNALYCSPLWIDGIERKIQNFCWVGLLGPIQSGNVWWFMPELKDYAQDIDADRAHEVGFKFGKYAAETFHFDPFDHHLNTAWDAMTPEIKDVPAPPVSVEGSVRDTGKGAPIYTVLLRAKGQKDHVEYTDKEGRFQFVGLEPGTYTTGCAPINPGPYSYSKVSPESITISGSEPAHVVLKFRTW